jgi:hypothetical protein
MHSIHLHSHAPICSSPQPDPRIFRPHPSPQKCVGDGGWGPVVWTLGYQQRQNEGKFVLLLNFILSNKCLQVFICGPQPAKINYFVAHLICHKMNVCVFVCACKRRCKFTSISISGSNMGDLFAGVTATIGKTVCGSITFINANTIIKCVLGSGTGQGLSVEIDVAGTPPSGINQAQENTHTHTRAHTHTSTRTHTHQTHMHTRARAHAH